MPWDCYKESNIDEPEDEINQEKNDEFNSKEDRLLAIDIDLPELNRHLREKSNFATDIAEVNQEKRTWEQIVPKHYLQCKEVFEKQTFNQLPP
jgi:hypothetical protein